MQRLAPAEAEIFVPQLNEKRRIKTTFCKVKKHGVRKPNPCGALIILLISKIFLWAKSPFSLRRISTYHQGKSGSFSASKISAAIAINVSLNAKWNTT